MNTNILNTIRENVKLNSDRIFQIKNQVKPHINPKSELWDEYLARKREVTTWLIALHTYRSYIDSKYLIRIKSHFIADKIKYKNIINKANEYVDKLQDKYRNEVSI